ncbi:MAG TPA: hypothetical protein VHS97_03040 [Isosphaeraceae bacterium]|nr:hypothetical protein [Isosphaeraceae bacterium]
MYQSAPDSASPYRLPIYARWPCAAGRAYAAYGGVYILSSLAWLWVVEGTRPDRWDVIGAAVCLIGAAVILYGPRS